VGQAETRPMNLIGQRNLLAAVGCFVLFVAPGVMRAQIQDHQYSTADVEAGSRLYSAQCALCHGPTGETVVGVNLRRQQFRTPLSDEGLRQAITVGAPAKGMPGYNFQAKELDGLVAFIRAGFEVGGVAVKVGDAARGKAIYDGKGACASCHRINGVGPRSAPDLSDIGAVRQPSALQRSLLEPSKGMMPINRPVRLVTKDGRVINGRRLNEDTASVQLIDEQERLLSFLKADLKEYQLSPTSPMPSVAGKLSEPELADLVAYLVSLKGP
jgi:cytochrome c oxidase cbb3-type subunit 3